MKPRVDKRRSSAVTVSRWIVNVAERRSSANSQSDESFFESLMAPPKKQEGLSYVGCCHYEAHLDLPQSATQAKYTASWRVESCCGAL